MRALGVVVMGLLASCGGQLNVGQDGSTSGAGGESSQMGARGGNFASGGMANATGGATGNEMGLGGSVTVPGMSGNGGVGMVESGGQVAMNPYGGQVGMNAFGGVGTAPYGGQVGMSPYGGQVSAAGGAATVGGAAAALPEWPPTNDVTEMPDITGVWEGYTEDFLFRAVDKFRVEIAGLTDDGIIRGSVRFGDGMLPPASDPDAAYPGDGKATDPQLMYLSPTDHFVDGATYTIVDGVQRAQVVRFEVLTSEVMRSWCELQKPYLDNGGNFSCRPGSGYSVGKEGCQVRAQEGTVYEFTAAKCYQCDSCACDAMTCTARQSNTQAFDLSLDMAGNQLSGTVGGTPIQLERVE
jgi:hypothetical protein